jgi:SAM-dependent methyltransferase
VAPGIDYSEIYARQADAYDAMVSAEDADGRLPPALEAVAPLDGARVLEVGAGTGRLTRVLLGRGARVIAVDRAGAMLAVARRRLGPREGSRCVLARAEARALPVRSGWADAAFEGWAFGHLCLEHPGGWRAAVSAAIAEMERALRPGGALALIESLGTGHEAPHPPSAELAELFGWLEADLGMRRVVVRTDFAFPDVESAARATGFFFGEAFARRVRERGWARIPECTGVWWRTRHPADSTDAKASRAAAPARGEPT